MSKLLEPYISEYEIKDILSKHIITTSLPLKGSLNKISIDNLVDFDGFIQELKLLLLERILIEVREALVLKLGLKN